MDVKPFMPLGFCLIFDLGKHSLGYVVTRLKRIAEAGTSTKPPVEFIGIDPATRTITGRVIPAGGTCVVSPPLKRAFGFHRIFEDDGNWREGDDWGEWLNNGVDVRGRQF